MPRLPRLAVGTVQNSADSSAIIWALLACFEQAGVRVQSFLSRACLTPVEGAGAITGLSARHLDSWMMTRELCREIFLRGCNFNDLALVEGRYAGADQSSVRQPRSSSLEAVCDWLDLPQLAVIDASQLHDCQLPSRPANLAGLLLDRVSSESDYCRLQTMFESLWGVPVLGWLPELRQLRGQVRQVPLGDQPTRELCQALGDQFSARSQMSRIWQVAAARELPFSRVPPMVPRHDCAPLHVSVAYDEAFHCYFPDTLDVLELRGADVSDFSPLRDERLPAGTDIVYFGCGHPERFARELADNDCMIAALRDHLCMGKRIYAEGGAAAYLCQRLITLDGQQFPMVGVFNAVARMNPHATEPKPVEIALAEANWLGSGGTVVRGYLNDAWMLEATGPLRQFVDSDSSQLDLIGQHQAIGSRVHLNFAAQPEVLNRFFESHAPSLDLPQPAVR